MDSKEIKSTLKAVKENLIKKDYKTAVKQCMSILKVDRNNYLALVFYGAAVQETEQKEEAPKAFKKAIEISPEDILAWKGLASFYEKNEKTSDLKDLCKVYGKLLVLDTDLSKLNETIEKFEKLAVSFGEPSDIKTLCEYFDSVNDQRRILVMQCLVSVIASNANLSEVLILEYENLIRNLISIRPYLENFLDLFMKYLKILCRQENYKEIIIETSKVLENYPDNISLLEWVCKAYTEICENVLQEDLDKYSPKEVYLKLIQLAPNSYLGYFCKGVNELNSNDLLNARDSLKEAIDLKPNLPIIWLKLCLIQVSLYQFFEAEQSSLKALKYFEKVDKNEKNINLAEKKLLQSLCEQKIVDKWQEAEELGYKLLKANPSDPDILEYTIKALIKLGKYEEAKTHLSEFKKKEKYQGEVKYLECLFLYHNNNIEECKANLEELVKEIPDYYVAWLDLGKIYYNENDWKSCLTSLLKSAKLNQWCFLNFLYLGHCYQTMVMDLEKARRCYQKAFQLNPNDEEVGINLSNVYRILEKEDLNLQLLTNITTMNPKSKWAWLQLGLHYLSKNQHQDAINNLRITVRLDPNDKCAWECLGDAYFAQNAFVSSLKSYQRVIELEPDSVYPMLQIAGIKHVMGLFKESVEEFRTINDKFPNYIPALKGHSESCLSLMKHYMSQNLDGLAQDACQEAVTSLIKCLQQQKNLVCIWKLLGDSCTLLSNLSEKYCKLKVPSWLSSSLKQECKDDEVKMNKVQVLKLGCRSFGQAIAMFSNFSSLWYDLAFIYNRMAEFSKTEESRKQFRNLSCAAVKKSILLNENSWESWNLYGIILTSKEIQQYRFAQHCFIKAVTIKDTSAVIWTNLGTLYLNLDDLPIANQSFTEAQKCDHDYVLSWVGQAIIAKKTYHHDAMDLFRHSTQLGFSTEGCLGYSNLVCSTVITTKDKNDKNYLYAIENLNAVTVASDALTRYTDRITNNAWAFNMLGLLLERQKLHRRSSDAFKNALELVLSSKALEENENLDTMDKILLNYGRVLLSLKRYDEAITYLNQIKTPNYMNQCEKALAFYKNKLYKEAYSTYDTTLAWLSPNPIVEYYIQLSMAAVDYIDKGPEDAQVHLMNAHLFQTNLVEDLFALCALGILHSDLNLSELAIKELNLYKDDLPYWNHIAVFQAYMYLFKGQKERAIRALCEVTHRHPNQPSLWLSLSLLLLHLYPSFDSRSAARCAEVASISGRSSIDVSKVMSIVSLSNLLSGEGLKSLKSSQKAVHMFPDVTENWVVLVASVLSKCLVQESVEEIFWLKKMITYIRRKFESSAPMTQWLSKNDRKVSIMADKLVS